VLLGHFATVRGDVRAADLGIGTGAVGLFLLSRGAATVSGLELNPRIAGLAERTAALNGLSSRMKIICGDVNQIKSYCSAGSFDLVTVNPPYRPQAVGRISPTSGVAMARHETTAGLREFVQASAFLLRNRGRLAMIHLPERLADICVEMRDAGLEPKRLRFVHPFSDRAPRMVLVESVKGAHAGLSVMPPLIVYQARNEYHPEIVAYYR
jgi:tRNA1(Val) A37 N6-methylase TrmN6